jgi:hypothetical protein
LFWNGIDNAFVFCFGTVSTMLLFFVLSIVDTVPKQKNKSIVDTLPKQKTKALSIQFQNKKQKHC